MIQNQKNKFKSAYKNSSVLVTGGSGFIGSHLVDALVELGARVTVLDNAQHIPYRNQRANYIQKNILDQRLFSSNKFDYVFHLAARCDLDGKDITDYSVNYMGTLSLLRQLDHNSIKRFVFYSTQLVVGIYDETRFLDWTEPYKTKTPYGLSKIAGEYIVKKYCLMKNVDWTIIRPTSVYGPRGGQPYREFFRQIALNRYVHIGKASNLTSMAFVDNIVDLTLTVSSSTSGSSQVFYGTDFHPYTMREFANEAAKNLKVQIRTVPKFAAWIIAYSLLPFKLIGLPTPLYPFRLKNILSNYCYDIQNAVEAGYNPKWDLINGMRKSIAWYVKHDSDFSQKFKDENNTRIQLCSYCRSRNTITVYTQLSDRFKIVKKNFDVCYCRSCGITYTAMDEFKDFELLYPKNYLVATNITESKLSKLYRFDQYTFDTNLLTKATHKEIHQFMSYLDIGCGSGERLQYMKNNKCSRVTGIDKFDNTSQDVLNEKTVTYINAEITDFKPKNKFQLASMFHVLEHVPDIKIVLNHINKHILRDDGYLIIQVPNYNSVERKLFGKRWFGLDIPRHLWHFKPESLEYVLKQSGFKVIATFQKNAPFHPVTFAPSLLPSADPQKVWASSRHDNAARRHLFKFAWIFITLLSIPYSWILSAFDTATMLTVVAVKNNSVVQENISSSS